MKIPDNNIPTNIPRYEQIDSEEAWTQLQVEIFKWKKPEFINVDLILQRPFNRLKLPIIEKHIPEKKCKILELGCYLGAFSEYFARQGHDVTAVDMPEIIEVAKRDNGVNFQACNLNKDFPNGKYDIILCLQIIEHIVKDFELLQSIYKHLKSGGIAVVDTVVEMTRIKQFYMQAHVRAYPGYSLEALMKIAGFKILETKVPYLERTQDKNILVVGKK